MSRSGAYSNEEMYREFVTWTADTPIEPPAEAIWCNSAGNVALELVNDGGSVTTGTLTFAASQGLNLNIRKVLTSGTTSLSDIVLLRK